MSAKLPAKPQKDTIYVDVDDEITSIIDKIENSQHKIVALVLPKRAASLQSTVNMKLLKRSADNAGKNVVLITSEHALMPLAGAAGLHVAKNLQSVPEIPDAPPGVSVPDEATTEQAELSDSDEPEAAADESEDEPDMPKKYDYGKPIGVLAAAHAAENPETIDLDEDEANPDDTAPAAKTKTPKVKVPDFDRFRLLLGLGIVAIIALIVFLYLAVSVLPKATININTTSEPVSANFTLNASAATQTLDTAKAVIPAKLETSDQTGTQSVQATGQQNNGDKATGSVSMTVCVNGSAPSDVPAGTGVSASGLTYITQQAAHFGPTFQTCSGGVLAKSNNVDITAQQPGSKYNSTISGASVTNSNATASGSASGGTDNVVTVLSQSDVDSAKQKLTSGSAGDQFTKDFEKKLSDQGEYVLTTTLKVGDANITSTPSVGQPASTANVNVKITYSVLTVKKADLSQAIQTKLASQVDKTKQKLTGNFLNDANVTIQSQSAPNAAVLNISEDTTAVPIIDVNAVKSLAAGKKTSQIQSALNDWPGVKDVSVKLSPFWVSSAPKKPAKITVVIKEIKTAQSNNSANSAP